MRQTPEELAFLTTIQSTEALVAWAEGRGAPTSWDRWALAARHAPAALLTGAALEHLLHQGTDAWRDCLLRPDATAVMREALLAQAVKSLRTDRRTVGATAATQTLVAAAEAGLLPPGSAARTALLRMAGYQASQRTRNVRLAAARILFRVPDLTEAELKHMVIAQPNVDGGVMQHPGATREICDIVAQTGEVSPEALRAMVARPELVSPEAARALSLYQPDEWLRVLQEAVKGQKKTASIPLFLLLAQVSPADAFSLARTGGALFDQALSPEDLAPLLSHDRPDVRELGLSIASRAKRALLPTR